MASGPVGLGAVQSELEDCERAGQDSEAQVDATPPSDVLWGVFSASSSSPELTRTAGSLSHIKVESLPLSSA